MKGKFICLIGHLSDSVMLPPFFIYHNIPLVGILNGSDEFGRDAILNLNVIPFVVRKDKRYHFNEKHLVFQEDVVQQGI